MVPDKLHRAKGALLGERKATCSRVPKRDVLQRGFQPAGREEHLGSEILFEFDPAVAPNGNLELQQVVLQRCGT